MASLLSRIKGGKKKGKQELPPPPAEDVADTGDQVEETNVPAGDTSNPVKDVPTIQPPLPLASPVSKSYVVPVVQASSIFSGLHLSSTVAGSECPDSPYMKEDPNGKTSFAGSASCSVPVLYVLESAGVSPEPEEESSSFSFLSAPEVNAETSEESPTQGAGDDAGGFSFLAQPPATDVVIGEEDIVQKHSPPVEQSEPSHSLSNQSEVVSGSTETSSCDQQSDVHSNTKSDTKKRVGQRLPFASGDKKKKRKAIRPGQGVVIEDTQLPPKVPANSDHSASIIEETNHKDREFGGAVSIEEDSVVTKTCHPESLPAVEDTVAPTSIIQATEDSDSGLLSEEQNPAPSNLKDADDGPSASSLVGERVDNSEHTSIDDTGKTGKDLLLQKESSPNYMVEFTHEETLAGLLQSYSNGLLRFR